MSDLHRRALVTIACLAAALLLGSFPVPGSGRSAGALGLTPYLLGSTLVAGFVLVTRRSPPEDDLERWILGACLACALVLSLIVAAFDPTRSPAGIVALVITFTGGTIFTVLLARAITTRGVGNGLCLLVGSSLALKLGGALVIAAAEGRRTGGISFLPILLLALGWTALVIAWTRERWTPRPSAADATLPAAVQLPVAAVGILPLGSVARLLALLTGAASTFELPSALAIPLATFGEPGIPWFVAVVLLSWGMGRSLHNQVQGERVLPAHLRAAFAPGEFERQSRGATRLFLHGTPVVGAIALLAFPLLGAPGFVPLYVPVVVAIGMDTLRQVRLHGLMAEAVVPGLGERPCSSCRAPVPDEDSWCTRCGSLFEEGMSCALHAGQAATARCILCEAGICSRCDVRRSGHHLCPRDQGHEFVGGWIVVARLATVLAAEERAESLRGRGYEAVVLAVTPGPLYGSPDLFQLRDVVPLAVHSRSAGSSIRVLVPAASALRALQEDASMAGERAS